MFNRNLLDWFMLIQYYLASNIIQSINHLLMGVGTPLSTVIGWLERMSVEKASTLDISNALYKL